jgi:hypothetical protein
MVTRVFAILAWVTITAASTGCALGATSTTEEYESDSVAMVAAHVPVCTKVGTAKEGWRWGDTGSFIRHAKCAGASPQCQFVGEQAEGWYAGDLIVLADCSDVARVQAVGEPCGPSIGYSCDSARAYCQGIPEEGKGGSGVCQPLGTCLDAADCGLADHAWSHLDVPGEAVCDAGQCVWAPEDCRTTEDCRDGLTCMGIPHDGSTQYGKCRSSESLSGEGAACGEALGCEPGLACVGLSMGPEGWCLPAWMVADYTNAKTYGTTSNVVAHGLATVPVDIVVWAELNKKTSSKWTLQLTDPNGVAAVVCSPSTVACTPENLAAGISVLGNSRDDAVNGRWTLQVKGSGSPKIKTWTLHLSSRMD